jgi:hypothetical protein
MFEIGCIPFWFLKLKSKVLILVKLDQILKRDFENVLNGFWVYKIKTFIKGFAFQICFETIFKSNRAF